MKSRILVKEPTNRELATWASNWVLRKYRNHLLAKVNDSAGESFKTFHAGAISPEHERAVDELCAVHSEYARIRDSVEIDTDIADRFGHDERMAAIDWALTFRPDMGVGPL